MKSIMKRSSPSPTVQSNNAKKVKLYHRRDGNRPERKRWTATPESIFYKIMSFVDNDTLINVSSVCKHTNRMISEGSNFVYNDKDLVPAGVPAPSSPQLHPKMENPLVREMVIRCGSKKDDNVIVPVGTKVYKYFFDYQESFNGLNDYVTESKLHTGVVSSYDHNTGWYRIVYDDDDQEDMSHAQVLRRMNKDKVVADWKLPFQYRRHILRKHLDADDDQPSLVKALKEKSSDDQGRSQLQLYRRVRVHNLNEHRDKYLSGCELYRILFANKKVRFSCDNPQGDKSRFKKVYKNNDDKHIVISKMNYVRELDCSAEEEKNGPSSESSLTASSVKFSPCVPTLPKMLAMLLPNLTEINMSGTNLGRDTLKTFSKACPLITKIVWNHTGSNQKAIISADGSDMKSFVNLQEISLDGCTLVGQHSFWKYAYRRNGSDDLPRLMSEEDYNRRYFHRMEQSYDEYVEEQRKKSERIFLLHKCCRNLVRVSMKDVSFEISDCPLRLAGKNFSKRFVDDTLTKIVRRKALMKPVSPLSPRLRWFRSNIPEDRYEQIREELAEKSKSSSTDLSIELVN
jgi:hypothetical protein